MMRALLLALLLVAPLAGARPVPPADGECPPSEHVDLAGRFYLLTYPGFALYEESNGVSGFQPWIAGWMLTERQLDCEYAWMVVPDSPVL